MSTDQLTPAQVIMATPDILDFDQLLQPISEEQPAGPELKEDERLRGVYQSVKDARETARVAEKKLYQAAWLDDGDTSNLERPDWKKVYDLASEALARQSKDLWIASWLIESLTRLHGFAGLRDGFRLARELVERFWDGIHPRPDEEGYATTVAQLTGLNGDDSEGALIAPIDRIPITAPGKLRALSSADYKQAIELDKIDPAKRTERIEQGGISLEMFQQAIDESTAEFFQGLLEDLEQSIDEYFRLGEALESRCGSSPDGYPAAPPTSAIRGALTDVRERLRNLTQHILAQSDSGEGAAEGQAGSPGTGSTTTSGKHGMNRDEAFRQLLQVAEFFRRTEPHSPVSYALEQAVRWGRMSLPDLLSELIGDPAARDDIFRRMGLPKKEEA
jgi:type VI secretion system protein ImpA